MLKISIFLLVLFLYFPIFGDVISPIIQYTQEYQNVRSIKEDDFQKFLKENESADIESGKIAIYLKFNEDISITSLEMYVNDDEITDLYYMGNFSQAERYFIIEVKNKYLVIGKNIIEFHYNDEYGEVEIKKWIFKTGTIFQKDYALPIQLTKGKGWKRSFSISPDGRFIAYILISTDKNAIKIYDLKTKTEKILVESKEVAKFGSSEKEKFYSFAPCWSRDGSYLFYISTQTGYHEIYRARISIEGEISDKRQLSQFKSYTTDLVISPTKDILFFISNKDKDKMLLYYVEDAENINNLVQFHNNTKRFSSVYEESSVFSPAISYDGKYLACCKQKIGENTFIEVDRVIENNKNKNFNNEKRIIYIKNQDCLYPSWSPNSLIISFFSGKSIYLRDVFNRDNNIRTASNCRMPTYAMKPSWDPSGKAIYYVRNDVNNSLRRIVIDLVKISMKKDEELLNDRFYRDNMEIAINSTLDFIIYNSFKTGSWELWALQQKIQNINSIISFRFKEPNQELSYFDKNSGKFRLLGYSPLSLKDNVLWERENVSTGVHRFLLNNSEFNIKTSPVKNEIQTKDIYIKRKNIHLKSGLYSTFIPGLGQKTSNFQKKGNYFLFSILGLASLSYGSYYLQEKYYNDYMESKKMEDIIENRDKYSTYSTLTNGIITVSSLIYALNIFDAFISKPKIPNEKKELHLSTYREIKSDIPEKRRIYSKENQGKGELKVFTSEPNVKIYLSKQMKEDDKGNYYGKTNYTFDKSTYFTIVNLDPGEYILKCKKDYFKPFMETVIIDEYKTSYKILRLESNFSLKLSKFFIYATPGLSQIKRDDKLKGYTICSIAGVSLLGTLISQIQANNEYANYNDAKSLDELIISKSDYHKRISQRNSFILLFSLNFIYNLYDAYFGGE